MTSCHAILSQKWSSAISIADQCTLKQIANKRCQNKGNWIIYKMAISDFQNVWILTPQISKNYFFWEKCSKIQNFPNFQKTYFMYRTYIRVFSIPNLKFVSQFLTPNDCNKCEMWWRHKNKSHFLAIYRHPTQKQITLLDSWDETESEKCVLFSKFSILKIDPFWPFLTWPSGQILKLKLPLVSTSKITYITCVARFVCSYPYDDLMWPDRDLDLYLL